MKAGWEVKALGELCEVRTGKKDVNEGNPAGVYPFFTCAREHTFSDVFSFDCEAILIAGNGEVGNLSYFFGKFEAYQRTYVLMNFTSVLPRYLLYVLYGGLKKSLFDQKLGNTMPYIKKGMLTDFPIPLPPLDEQKRIVEVLDAAFEGLSRARAHTETNLQNAWELFEQAQKEVFGEAGSDWEHKTVSECFRLKSGDGLTSSAMKSGQYPVFGGNGVAGNHDQFNLAGANVIIGRVGALCGNARKIEDKIWLTDNAFKVVDLQYDFDIGFLTRLLNAKNLRQFARQTAQPVISNSSLKDLPLSFPRSKSRQAEIARKLEDLEEEVCQLQSHYRAKLADLDALRQALLQKAFAGELT